MKGVFYTAILFVSCFFIVPCSPQETANTGNKATNAANAANANYAANPAATEADVKKLMSDLAAALAKNDADAASKFYSDDYHLVTPDGVDQTKTARLADMRSGATKFDSFVYDDINVRSYGDTAVAIATVKARGTVQGKPRTTDMRATLVFRKMADGWKVVSGQATPIAAAGTTPANSANTDKMAETNKSASSNMNK